MSTLRMFLGNTNPSWAQPGASLDLDFVNNRAIRQGLTGLTSDHIKNVNATGGYAQWADGHWSSFAANTLRRTDKGLLVEAPAVAQRVKWCRDMSNAAWVKTNMTSVLTQTGIDNGASSASLLTATAANATSMQSPGSGSSTYTFSIFLKRVTGTGPVQLTIDGTNFSSDLSSQINSSTWTRVSFTATATPNPGPGIRLVTSGDQVAADFAQLETGTYATSPILTTTVTLTRQPDVISLNLGTWWNTNLQTWYVEVLWPSSASLSAAVPVFLEGGPASGAGISISATTAGNARFIISDTVPTYYGSTTTYDTVSSGPTPTAGQIVKYYSSYEKVDNLGNYSFNINGTPLLANNTNTSPNINWGSLIYIGSRNGTIGAQTYIRRVSYQPTFSTGNKVATFSTPITTSSVTIIGDSRSTRTLGHAQALINLYPWHTISEQAVAGQTTDAISARFGGIPTTLTVSGNSIPTSGGVTVSNILPNLFAHWNFYNGEIHGSIAGVPGTLTFVSTSGPPNYYTAGNYTFTRDSSGSSVSVSNPVAFVVDGGTVQGQTASQLTANGLGGGPLAGLQNSWVIQNGGYNDIYGVFFGGTYSQAATLANIAGIAAVSKVPIVMSVYFGESILQSGAGGIGVGQSSVGGATSQAQAQTAIQNLISLNSALSSAYGANYLDLQAALITAGYGEVATVNGSNYTILNKTLLPDGTHFTVPSAQAVIGNIVASFLASRGFV